MNILIGDRGEMFRLKNFEKNLGITIFPKMLYGGSVREIPGEMLQDPAFFEQQEENRKKEPETYGAFPQKEKGKADLKHHSNEKADKSVSKNTGKERKKHTENTLTKQSLSPAHSRALKGKKDSEKSTGKKVIKTSGQEDFSRVPQTKTPFYAGIYSPKKHKRNGKKR